MLNDKSSTIGKASTSVNVDSGDSIDADIEAAADEHEAEKQ